MRKQKQVLEGRPSGYSGSVGGSKPPTLAQSTPMVLVIFS